MNRQAPRPTYQTRASARPSFHLANPQRPSRQETLRALREIYAIVATGTRARSLARIAALGQALNR